jgi:transglutaminase-like putative cysteine protease
MDNRQHDRRPAGDPRPGGRRRTIAAAGAVLCASTALYPVFSGTAWFWAGAGATLTVAAVGMATRLRRLPVPVCLLAGLAALLLYLNLIFSHTRSLALIVPTPSSLAALGHLAGQGITQSNMYAPPVPELGGMLLLMTIGIGVAAVFADLLAVRLNKVALAGVPLLLLFAAPFMLSVSRGWMGTTIVFCVSAAGYLTLLAEQGRERIDEWERLPADASGESGPGLRHRAPDTSAIAATGRRIGFASIVVALIVPVAVPGLHVTRLFGSGTPGIGGNGQGSISFPDPQTQISGDLREGTAGSVLSYTTTASSPGYLQIYVLDDLTAAGWTFSPAHLIPFISAIPLSAESSAAVSLPALPAPTGSQSPSGTGDHTSGREPTTTTHVTIDGSVTQSSDFPLPTPYPAVSVDVPGSTQVDPDNLMIFDGGTRASGLQYSVASLDLSPSEQALSDAGAPPSSIASQYLEVPASYDSLRSLAMSIVTGASTPYEKAIALQDWLADGSFAYSLNAPAITSAAKLQNFLVNTRTGYCQQFAYAMAVLARLLGIPSRVAYGYTQGAKQKDGSWLVTTHDAHAWPQLYFQGYGWLRFEPTPGGANGQGTATSPSYAKPQSGQIAPGSTVPITNGGGTTSGGTGGAGQSSAPRNHRIIPNDQGGGGGNPAHPAATAGGPDLWALAGLSLLGLLILLSATPAAARAVIRRRRWRAGARAGDAGLSGAAWRELQDVLADSRAGYRASETPRALATRVTGELRLGSDAVTALRHVTMAAERAQYSAAPADGTTLRHDSTIVRRAIAAAVPRRSRWLMRVFPLSVIAPVTFALARAATAARRPGTGQPRGPRGPRGWQANADSG